MKCTYQNEQILAHLLDAQFKLNRKRTQLEEILQGEFMGLDAIMDDLLDAALITVGIDKYSPLADDFIYVFFGYQDEQTKQETLEKLMGM